MLVVKKNPNKNRNTRSTAAPVVAGGGVGGFLVWGATTYIPDETLKEGALYIIPAVAAAITTGTNAIVRLFEYKSDERDRLKKLKRSEDALLMLTDKLVSLKERQAEKEVIDKAEKMIIDLELTILELTFDGAA